MAITKESNVIMGIDGDYRYVPVDEFLIEDKGEDVFYTKHPYALLTEEYKKENRINILTRVDHLSEGGAREFLENNEITRFVRVEKTLVKFYQEDGANQLPLYRDLVNYTKGLVKGNTLEIPTHFKSLQTYTTGEARSVRFYSKGREFGRLPNYRGSVCWGSHRISRNVPKEAVHNQYLNMVFNFDLSSPRHSIAKNKLDKLVNVLELYGYGNSDIEWLRSEASNSNFNLFDVFVILSFLGVNIDDYYIGG